MFFKMQIIATILMMVIIGAIIGGCTNYIAIKMLFRPYRALYIGKWRIPFTPGLIPKRRDELAKQMGKLVINHLLTPASIQQKFLNEGFQKEMTNVVQREIVSLLDTEKTLAIFLEKFGVANGYATVEGQLNKVIEGKYDSIMQQYRNKPLNAVIPENLIKKADKKIPEISALILQKGIEYFSSFEGKQQIQRMADDFLKERSGMLGSMMQMFIGNTKISEKIQPELIKFLQNEATVEMITALLKKEMDKFLEWEVVKIEDQFNKDEIIKVFKEFARKVMKLEYIFQTPISELTASYRTKLSETIAANGVQVFGQWLAARIEIIMERLRLQEIVQQQVESFPVERLEEMVLSITKSELKMITFLGFLLGGIIGIVQGVLAILLN